MIFIIFNYFIDRFYNENSLSSILSRYIKSTSYQWKKQTVNNGKQKNHEDQLSTYYES